jgi:hypothetical protein
MPIATHKATGTKVLFCANRCDTRRRPDGLIVEEGDSTMRMMGEFCAYLSPGSFAARAHWYECVDCGYVEIYRWPNPSIQLKLEDK